MSMDGTNRLERFLSTVAGVRFLEEAEADADRKEAAVQQRRDIAAERDDLLRRRREVLPAMRRAVEAAERDLAEARKAMAAAQARRADAGHAEFSEDFAISEGVRRAEIALTRTADPRLHAAVEEADEVLRTWSETYKNLHRFRSEKATSWDGTETWVKRFGTNEAGVDALKKAIEDAREALRKLMLLPEPGDEAIEGSIANLHAAIEATHGDPPPLVLQQFDSNGKPVGKPVEMPVAR
jgi:DNA repair exonuclease SbcCD ATPase subunit